MQPEIFSPQTKWRSLRELLDAHTPAILATAIEKNGVFVYDRFQRVVQAPVTGNDDYSKEKALVLLAVWQSELDDQAPTYSWDHEQYEQINHPTDRFRWPESKLPPLSGSTRVATDSSAPSSVSSRNDWVKAAHSEAQKVLVKERANGIEPKQDYVAKQVAIALQAMRIRTSRGQITWENIKREALAGKFWGETRVNSRNG